MFEKIAATDYADKYPVNPIQPDGRKPRPPNYTVSVEVMEEKHKISQQCSKSFIVTIDGITSAENPFTNKDVSKEITKDLVDTGS